MTRAERVRATLTSWARLLILVKDDRDQCYWSEAHSWVDHGDHILFFGISIIPPTHTQTVAIELFDDEGQLVESQGYDRLIVAGHPLHTIFRLEAS